MSEPKISVVVPVYNAEKYIGECLESIIAQTIFEKIEIIVVDDGSSDSSKQICDRYAEKYTAIAVIHQENAGVSAARNAGISAAQGEFIGFVDGDDTVYPEMYERLLSDVESSGADAAVCAIFHPYPDKDVTIEYPFDTDTALGKEYISETIAPFMLRDSSFNSVCNKIFRRSVIMDNSLRLSLEKKQGEDREFLLKFLNLCRAICVTNYVGYYYRNVPTSAIQKPRFDYADTIFALHESDRVLFETLGIAGDEFDNPSCRETANGLLCALAFANNKLRGKDRKAVIKSIIDDRKTIDFLNAKYEFLAKDSSRFDKLLLAAMKKRSTVKIRAVMALMKIKVALYNLVKG